MRKLILAVLRLSLEFLYSWLILPAMSILGIWTVINQGRFPKDSYNHEAKPHKVVDPATLRTTRVFKLHHRLPPKKK